jgi:hypothetical protein
MKFKNTPDGNRELVIVDKDGDRLSIYVFKTKHEVVIDVNGVNVGTSRNKALKLAWAIIEEFSPSPRGA